MGQAGGPWARLGAMGEVGSYGRGWGAMNDAGGHGHPFASRGGNISTHTVTPSLHKGAIQRSISTTEGVKITQEYFRGH